VVIDNMIGMDEGVTLTLKFELIPHIYVRGGAKTSNMDETRNVKGNLTFRGLCIVIYSLYIIYFAK
jgi:hypothetical protein